MIGTMVKSFTEQDKEVDTVLDLMKGRDVSVEYIAVNEDDFSHGFYYYDFLGFVQDGFIFLGDINRQDSIRLESVERMFAYSGDMCYSVDIEFKNGNVVKLSC